MVERIDMTDDEQAPNSLPLLAGWTAIAFDETQQRWLSALADADGMAYLFNSDELGHLRSPVAYQNAHLEAEQGLAQLTSQHELAGVWVPQRVPVRAPVYRLPKPSPVPPAELLANLFKISLEEARGCQIELEQLATSPLYDSARAAAGGLLSCPTFLTERDQLRAQWRALPAEWRIQFPFGERLLMTGPSPQPPEDPPPSITTFLDAYQAFLQRWRLSGFDTWDLPNPLEFHPQDYHHPPRQHRPNQHVTTISGLMPLKRSEPRVAKSQLDADRKWRQSMQLEMIDQHAALCSSIARLHFYELALDQRLRVTQTQLTSEKRHGVLSDFVGIDAGNVAKHLRQRDNWRRAASSDAS